jgi:hypothetical protein
MQLTERNDPELQVSGEFTPFGLPARTHTSNIDE